MLQSLDPFYVFLHAFVLIFVTPLVERFTVRFVVIGHLTRDLIPQGHTLGGAASYAAITAQRLGADVTILTRAHPDDAHHPALAGIEVINLPSAHTTIFQNIYHDGLRSQQLRAVAAPIFASDVPEHLLAADIVLLAPVCQEVDPAIAARLRGLVGVSPQGWLREWNSRGRVRPTPWISAGRILPSTDVLVFSEADMTADPGSLATVVQRVGVVVLTQSADGCLVFIDGAVQAVPPRPAAEVDPTGAGDIFAAAFLVHLLENHNPIAAAYFANVTASFSVEALGVTGIPDRATVESYSQAHPLA